MAFWIKVKKQSKSTMYRCSECGDVAYSTPNFVGCTYKYCPNCGVIMDEEVEKNKGKVAR